MKLIVGLGNPGPQYELTRHNIGFLAIDELIRKFGSGATQGKHQAFVTAGQIGSEAVLFIKPQTFMNLSGRSVQPLYQFYKLKPEDVIVLHDELDIAPGEIRFKKGGGNGGHNGLRSIDESLGSDQTGYFRVRLGIGHPRDFNPKIDVADWVLGKIPKSDWTLLPDLFFKAEQGISLILQGKLNEAMNKFHGRVTRGQDK